MLKSIKGIFGTNGVQRPGSDRECNALILLIKASLKICLPVSTQRSPQGREQVKKLWAKDQCALPLGDGDRTGTLKSLRRRGDRRQSQR